MGADRYDVIVVGGGHNGLVAAAYLARMGARVVVLESRHKTGGAADTSSPFPEHPDVKVTTLSYVMSLMPPSIVRDLRLEAFGYRVVPMGGSYAPQPGAGGIRDDEGKRGRFRATLAPFSTTDADAYEDWSAWLARSAAFLGPLLMETPPDLGSLAPGDLVDQVRFALRHRAGMSSRLAADITKLFTMSAVDLLDEWFESTELKALIATSGIIGTWAGPEEPGTAYVLMHHAVGDLGDGNLSEWGYPTGGMGAVSDALRRSAESHGAEIRVRSRVERILVEAGAARGVVTAAGEEYRAPLVISACHPKITFLEQIPREDLPGEFVRDIENWRTRSGTVKINLALSHMPAFRDDPSGEDPEIAGSSIMVSPTIRYLEKAFEEARDGAASTAPFSETCIPSYYDPTLAPEGMHVMSMFTQWVPHEWAAERHQDELEAYADRMVDIHDDFMPGFKDAIVGRQVIGPWQMENEWGLIGGNIFHGELSPDQLFHMRPAPGYADYRTPIHGLYQASSATHAGGGVTGLPGHHVVREIVKDRKRSRFRRRGRGR
ncbi:MAG: NAD(P)/FAD-dependent oxidoreductase [Actinomycetota bacterium]|nr:NAD(P)/FAD-dependent oxidoreductase [Actinomycetota bacterium]MDH5224561.1 NAD(P)/FAD-dependent oxidoreductase [Actinomycetota bacterium]